MRLSMKSDYALRALLTLGDRYGQGPMSIGELARRNDAPKRFLEQIMLELKDRGIVRSQAGRSGGFVLARRPQEVSIGEVVRGFDGVLAPIHCCSITRYEHCSQESACRLRRILLGIRNETARVMDSTTLASLLAGREPAEEARFAVMLTEGAGI
jgi:Rrf2 family protein